jgi:uncharacterized protein YecE (DUF72 family)
MSGVHIGAQGWNYQDWIGSFYPRGTKAVESLDLYVRAFDTVEIDATFYAIPSAATIHSWQNRAPAGFIYALKLPQQITHEQRLHDSAATLAEFCARARGLKEKLGAILVQLPPDFSPRAWSALEKFVPLLPADLQFAVEFRDRAWLNGEMGERLWGLLSEHKIALALVDGPWISRALSLHWAARPTANFAYVRWLGTRELTEFSRVRIEREQEFQEWMTGIAALREQVATIYGYFSNFYQGHSPASANRFKELLGLPVVTPETLSAQPSLF